MERWLVAVLLGIGGHFAASFLVPLDRLSQATFGGLLRWLWPWSEGDRGVLGTVSAAASPTAGVLLAITAGSLLVLAALGVLGWWVPTGWRALALGGAALSLVLFALFFGPTKLLPMAWAVGTAYVAWSGVGGAR